jgi:IclR family KDG regulon transcriptional repressor
MMNKTIVKAMDILYLFRKHPKLALKEIIELSGKPKTSVHRVIRSFEKVGFLEKDDDGYYQLGILFLQFGNLVLERLDIHQIAMPFMKELHNEVNKTVILTIREGNETVNIASIEAHEPITVHSTIGEKSPLYVGSMSRIILAFLKDEEREKYVEETTLRKFAEHTIIDKNKLRLTLEQTKLDGYCFSTSEINNQASGLSAPIFNHKGDVIAGLTITGLYTSFTEEKVPIYIGKVKDATVKISKKLGYIKKMNWN